MGETIGPLSDRRKVGGSTAALVRSFARFIGDREAFLHGSCSGVK